MGKIFAVLTRKGGTGKSTSSVNLAHGLSRRLLTEVDIHSLDESQQGQVVTLNDKHYWVEGHILLIDLDPQGNVSEMLGIEPNGADIGELLVGRQTIRDSIVSADRVEDGYPRPNLWIIPASDNLAKVKAELITASAVSIMSGESTGSLGTILEHRLGLIKDRFAYIIIDCPPTLDIYNNAVYEFADGIIIPIKSDYLSTSGAGRNVRDILDAQTKGIDIRVHTILPTFYVPSQKLDREMMNSLKRRYGQKMIATPIPKRQKVAEAPAMGGLTLFEYDPQGDATEAYQDLVERIYNE